MNTTPSHHYIGLNGIVDKVRAVRGGSDDDVRYVEATIHVKMGEDYKSTYGGNVTTDVLIPLPVTTEINPGDVASITIDVVNPFGKRFVGALTVGNEEADDDDDDDHGTEVLEVNVEDGLIAEENV